MMLQPEKKVRKMLAVYEKVTEDFVISDIPDDLKAYIGRCMQMAVKDTLHWILKESSVFELATKDLSEGLFSSEDN